MHLGPTSGLLGLGHHGLLEKTRLGLGIGHGLEIGPANGLRHLRNNGPYAGGCICTPVENYYFFKIRNALIYTLRARLSRHLWSCHATDIRFLIELLTRERAVVRYRNNIRTTARGHSQLLHKAYTVARLQLQVFPQALRHDPESHRH